MGFFTQTKPNVDKKEMERIIRDYNNAYSGVFDSRAQKEEKMIRHVMEPFFDKDISRPGGNEGVDTTEVEHMIGQLKEVHEVYNCKPIEKERIEFLHGKMKEYLEKRGVSGF